MSPRLGMGRPCCVRKAPQGADAEHTVSNPGPGGGAASGVARAFEGHGDLCSGHRSRGCEHNRSELVASRSAAQAGLGSPGSGEGAARDPGAVQRTGARGRHPSARQAPCSCVHLRGELDAAGQHESLVQGAKAGRHRGVSLSRSAPHLGASWHVQNGTPLHVLQELGGWETPAMVRRYAHLAPEHLAAYAGKVELTTGTNPSQQFAA
jgi:hypothetical protein